MNEKQTVLILFGGESSEHEISRISAASVLGAIDRQRFDVRTAGITREGSWFLTEADAEEIRDGSWERKRDNAPLVLSMNGERRGFYCRKGEACVPFPVDVVFPLLHGKNGEDGTVQGLLHMAGIPYVGSGTAASAACMDKGMTKALVEQAQVARQARSCIVHRAGCDPAQAAERVTAFFDGEYPLFVKPAGAGSSVGISKVHGQAELIPAIRTAFHEDGKILVEEAIEGRELEVAVLGNEDPDVSAVGEIFTAGEFYDYESKYNNPASRTGVAEDLSEEKKEEIQAAAELIYRVMGCRGLARVDFFLQSDGTVVFNEINTMPGFTEISMYPALWQAEGMDYGELIARLISLALEAAGR